MKFHQPVTSLAQHLFQFLLENPDLLQEITDVTGRAGTTGSAGGEKLSFELS